MNGPATIPLSLTLQCEDKNVHVIYAAGLIVVDQPNLYICHGYDVIFHFHGRPGAKADIIPIPDNPSNAWLKRTEIDIPAGQPVAIDTTPSTPGQDYRYKIRIYNTQDDEGNPVELMVDPIVRPR